MPELFSDRSRYLNLTYLNLLQIHQTTTSPTTTKTVPKVCVPESYFFEPIQELEFILQKLILLTATVNPMMVAKVRKMARIQSFLLRTLEVCFFFSRLFLFGCDKFKTFFFAGSPPPVVATPLSTDAGAAVIPIPPVGECGFVFCETGFLSDSIKTCLFSDSDSDATVEYPDADSEDLDHDASSEELEIPDSDDSDWEIEPTTTTLFTPTSE